MWFNPWLINTIFINSTNRKPINDACNLDCFFPFFPPPSLLLLPPLLLLPLPPLLLPPSSLPIFGFMNDTRKRSYPICGLCQISSGSSCRSPSFAKDSMSFDISLPLVVLLQSSALALSRSLSTSTTELNSSFRYLK